MEAPPKKEKPIVDSTNCTPTWMVTMGDTMSLLLCFFVMMLNFGSLHSETLANLFGVLSGGNQTMPREAVMEHALHSSKGGSTDHPIIIRESDIPARVNDLKRRLATSGFRHHITIDQLREGIRIRIADDTLFGPDNSLTEQAKTVLADVVNILQAVGNEIRLLASPAAGEAGPAEAIAVADHLVAAGNLRRSRIGIGTGTEPGEQPFFTILLMEKAGTKELRFADLWDERDWRP